jgi:amino acid permease
MKIVASSMMLSPNAALRMGGSGSSGRSWVDRSFKKLDRGSLRGSIFSLCASAIGSGVLSLPYVLNLCGYAQGLFFMLLGATGAEVSLRMLATIAVEEGLPNYSKIAIKAGGSSLNLLLSVMILLFMFGSCISYQIIVTSLF